MFNDLRWLVAAFLLLCSRFCIGNRYPKHVALYPASPRHEFCLVLVMVMAPGQLRTRSGEVLDLLTAQERRE